MSTTELEILLVSQVSVIQTISTSFWLMTTSRSSILLTSDLVLERNKEGKELFSFSLEGTFLVGVKLIGTKLLRLFELMFEVLFELQWW
jgi:hypothetical protein